jgi:hypothetical protein
MLRPLGPSMDRWMFQYAVNGLPVGSSNTSSADDSAFSRLNYGVLGTYVIDFTSSNCAFL